MAELYYLHCSSCGGALSDHRRSHCAECTLALVYRAMPFILGMLLAPAPLLAPVPARRELIPAGRHLHGGYDDENALSWE